MDLSFTAGLPALTVFLQGILSFFSPCVLPLVPLYIGYLAGGTKTVDENGSVHYKRSKVLVNTIFFVVGISFAFFLLGFGFSAAGQFFKDYQNLIAKVGGVLIILFGLFQLGVFGSHLLNREHRLPFKLNKLAMNPLLALALGFTFSFAWTPCVGPALATVLLMAGSVGSAAVGFLLIGVYTLGFVLPFLAVGLFTGSLLEIFKKHRAVVKYTVKIGGVLLILMGVLLLTGWMNRVTSYFANLGGSQISGQQTQQQTPGPPSQQQPNAENNQTAGKQKKEPVPVPVFTLQDKDDNTVSLSDYQEKVVFINFWTTWCGYCKEEMPDLQELYEEYGSNLQNVIFLSIANPQSEAYPYNQDISAKQIIAYFEGGGYAYPLLLDTTGEVYDAYGLHSFPTSVIVDKKGNLFAYIPGALPKETLKNTIAQALASSG